MRQPPTTLTLRLGPGGRFCCCSTSSTGQLTVKLTAQPLEWTESDPPRRLGHGAVVPGGEVRAPRRPPARYVLASRAFWQSSRCGGWRLRNRQPSLLAPRTLSNDCSRGKATGPGALRLGDVVVAWRVIVARVRRRCCGGDSRPACRWEEPTRALKGAPRSDARVQEQQELGA